MTVSIERQLKAARRELAMRKSVYPGRVKAGKMTQEAAADETEAMAAIVETLERLDAAERLI